MCSRPALHKRWPTCCLLYTSSAEELADAAQLSSLADETPEGRSVVILAKEKFGIRERHLGDSNMKFIPFSAKTRMSGVDFDGNEIRKGAADAIQQYVIQAGGTYPEECDNAVKAIASQGGTPLVVAKNHQVLGVIHLKDSIKQGVKEKFADLRKMGIKTIMITGDNPMTASAIAAEAGVDDFLAEATPEGKLQMIRDFQACLLYTSFKKQHGDMDDVDIIGQFGVGFYSAFMVSKKIQVLSKALDSDEAWLWESTGADGYTVTPAEKETCGTVVTLSIKDNSEENDYDKFLEPYTIKGLVKKYSDYIRYPIVMAMPKSRKVEGSEDSYESYMEEETLNSMIPIWKQAKSELTPEAYNQFYKYKFFAF